MIIAEYPENKVLIGVKTPTGEHVLVVPKTEYVLAHRQASHPLYRQICYIEGNRIIAGEGYAHDRLIPEWMDNYEFATQCEEKGSKWR